MDILVRGKYVITSAHDGPAGILGDGAVFVSEGRIAEVDAFETLKNKHAQAAVKGDGRQLLMPGLIDGHSHGWGLTTVQRGLTGDFLENALLDWAFMFDLDPELNAMMSAVRHLRNGCTTMHHNGWGEGPSVLEQAEAAIRAYERVGVRLAFSPGGRNKNRLALDEALINALKQ